LAVQRFFGCENVVYAFVLFEGEQVFGGMDLYELLLLAERPL